MSFNSSEVVVHGHAINNVEGDQVNQTINAQVVYINGQREIERTEYDEFRTVNRGDTVTLERLHTEDLSEWEDKDGDWVKTRLGQRTVCTVEVHQRKYTALVYEGDGAETFWKRDFEAYSTGLGKPEIWQLYGLNRSKIPFLIFHGELVPLANVYKHSFWGDLFVACLFNQLHCVPYAIWLNTKGNLCKGLDGPYVDTGSTSVPSSIIVRSSAQFLQSDISFQYFLQIPSPPLDKTILEHARWQYETVFVDELLPKLADHYPPSEHTHSDWTEEYPYLKRLFRNWPNHLPLDVISGLRFDTIYSPSRGAVASRPRDSCLLWGTHDFGLVNKTEMGDGLIRFELDESGDVEIAFSFQNGNFEESWLTQSSRIVDAHKMSGTEEEQCFAVRPPPFKLTLPHSEHQKPTLSLTFENPRPIYLFIHSPPMSISELMPWLEGHTRTHFWSLDENGRSEMSVEECKQWGVPELVPLIDPNTHLFLRSWQTTIYTPLCQWQVARGFDPTTTDWAQSVGCTELEIISRKNNKARFEELHKNTPWEHLSKQETKSSSWWPWSRKAAAGSGPVSVKTGDQLDSDWEVISTEDT